MKEATTDSFETLHARVFKGVLLDADIAAREERGELPTQAGEAIVLLGKYGEYFSRELQDRAAKMTYIYGLFYCIENAIRQLVAQRLGERLGVEWWASVPDTVRRRVEQKIKDVEENKWHQAVFSSNIDYTLFGDLASIITVRWQEFEDLFPSQPWVNQRLNELERSRNVIAHANLLPDPEIERIEQYLDDWLRQVP